MRLLALETATGSCSVCALADGAVVVRFSEQGTTRQAERIVPLVEDAMNAAGWSWTDVDMLAVDIGPGSFAGIRAGVAAGRGLALAAGLPCLGVTSLEALAAAGSPGPVVCVVAGRQGRSFVQRFAADGRPDGPASSVDPAAAEALAQPGDTLLVAGRPVEIDAVHVARAALSQLAGGRQPGPGHELLPFYLRDSGAGAEAGRPLVGQRA
ncbi:MAG: tRNA (adenosine(37)-N6)-threonylcarbamoyltransferase complex dimerization subunit type 1 TsaB [Geminicoccaceae bacterium]